MEVTARIDGISISDHSVGGYVDVHYWCREGEALVATAQVRMWYERKDVPLEAIEEDAIRRGVEVCGMVSRHAEVDPSRGEDLWTPQPKSPTGDARIRPRVIS